MCFARPTRAAIVPLLLLATTLAAASCSKDDDGPTGSNPGTTIELNGALAPSGGIYAHRFFAAGSYPYHCTIHSGMSGSVTVSSSAPAADSSQAVLVSGITFTPPSVTIPVGGIVTWTNSDNVAHTVTSD